MNTDSYFQAIRGPAILLTLGILMLLDHRDAVSFHLTWPALVIVYGLLVLAERLTRTAPPPPFPPAPPPFTGTGGYQS
jgi:hypothetical protein